MTEKPSIPSHNENKCLKPGKHQVWKFVHQKDYKVTIDFLQNRTCDYDWLGITEDGTITVKGSFKNGYAWDGCTPKVNLFHITWGTCDGKLKRFGTGDYKPYTYYASMIHDVLYQYKRCAPITRKEADIIFYRLLKQAGFMWAWVYFAGVRLLGWWFSGWKYKSRKVIQREFQNDL
ncbi:MAG: DUF1353 domain-containing protein [Bacteroidales bacterium]|nr:DUF1353 domain-containing protein [Bacteroidales bacterium]MCF8404487.1 DUF1353 domain-containing protein [Bacteroidales bacterium]